VRTNLFIHAHPVVYALKFRFDRLFGLQVIEECVTRLDVAMFNGILRDPEDDVPTDPLADPITDLSVLPIPIGSLTFGAGSHLKNVVCTSTLNPDLNVLQF
jgi:hypothetical protein